MHQNDVMFERKTRQNKCNICEKAPDLTLRRRIKSHLLFAGIIRRSPFSPR